MSMDHWETRTIDIHHGKREYKLEMAMDLEETQIIHAGRVR